MTVELEAIFEDGVDDTQTIEIDIKALANKFLFPIDALRSNSAVPLVSNQFTLVSNQDEPEAIVTKLFSGLEVNPNRPMESRASAFFRMIGLPISDQTGSYYNPGFEPNIRNKLEAREKVNSTLLSDQALARLINDRERWPHERRVIFSAQDAKARAYTISLRHIKPFLSLADGLGPFDADTQVFQIQSRKEELKDFLDDSGNPLVHDFDKGKHILKPFIPHPQIAATIIPQTSHICVPFLANKNSTLLSPNDPPLKRPYIEYICRLRLKQQETDPTLVSEVQRLLTGTKTAAGEVVAQTISDTVSALIDNNTLIGGNNNEIIKIISNFTTLEVSTIANYVKTIKKTVETLVNIIDDLNAGLDAFDIQPVAGSEGPEFPDQNAFVKTVGGASELEAKIARLKLEQDVELFRNKVESQKLGAIGGDIGSLFAGPSVAVVKKDLSSQIQRLERVRDEVGHKLLEHIADIERITGEISGLGLIDVLAIYTALWAIDLDTLVALLDEDAFNRLYELNPELRNSAVIARKNGGGINIPDALQNFEKKVFNILSFADKLVVDIKRNPNNTDLGEPAQG